MAKKGNKAKAKPKAAKKPTTWKTYEEVARYLLNQFAAEFGIDSVEGKQKLAGNSGTTWEIDAKGVRKSDGGIMVVECRRFTTSKQSQDKLASLAWRIQDLGAIGGIIVSPLGIQKGAKLVAKAADIFNVTLSRDSTEHDFVIGFLDKFRAGKDLPLYICGADPATPS